MMIPQGKLMNTPDRQAHWQNVYTTKAESEVSWFQDNPTISLELIAATGAGREAAIIDIGGGTSRLVDVLVERGLSRHYRSRPLRGGADNGEGPHRPGRHRR